MDKCYDSLMTEESQAFIRKYFDRQCDPKCMNYHMCEQFREFYRGSSEGAGEEEKLELKAQVTGGIAALCIIKRLGDSVEPLPWEEPSHF